MVNLLQTFRALSGSQVVYFTNNQAKPSGLTNITLVSSLNVETEAKSNLVPVESWTLNGDSGLTGSVDGTLLSLQTGAKIFGPGPIANHQSIFFNGASRIAGPVTASLQLTGSVTLSAFIFPTGLSAGTVYPINFGADGELESGNVLYSFRFAADNEYNVQIESGAGSDSFLGPATDFNLQPGQWHHLVYARDENSTNFMYHNGELIHSGTEGGPTGGTSSFMNIGALAGDTNDFTGYIYLVKVFDRALTNDEIRLEFRNVLGNMV